MKIQPNFKSPRKIPCCYFLVLYLYLGAALFFSQKLTAQEAPLSKTTYLILEAGVTKKYRAPIKGKIGEVHVKPQQLLLPMQKIFSFNNSRYSLRYEAAKKEYLKELELFTQVNTGRVRRVEYARKAELENAYQKFKALEILLSLHETVADSPGIVDQVRIVSKQLVRQEEICVIVKEIDTLQVKTPIYADDIRQGISIDLLVEVTMKESENSTTVKYLQTKGEIKSLTAERGITPARKSSINPMLIAEISINNPQLKLRPGMKVHVAGTKSFEEIIEKKSESNKFIKLKELTPLEDDVIRNQELMAPTNSGLELINKQFEELFSEQGKSPKDLSLTYADVDQLINEFRELPVDMQRMLEDLTETFPELGEISKLSQEIVIDEFQQALKNGEFDRIDLEDSFIESYLKLTEEEKTIFQEYQEELKQIVFEENIDLTYLDVLNEIEGVAEYKQQLLELKHLQTKFGIDDLKQLSPEKIASLKENVFKSIGLPALLNQDVQESLSLESSGINEIIQSLKERDQAAFSHLETLVETTLSDEPLKNGIIESLEKRNTIIQEEKRRLKQKKEAESQENGDGNTISPRDERRQKNKDIKQKLEESAADELGSDDQKQVSAEKSGFLEYYKKYEKRILPLSLSIVFILSGILVFLKYQEHLGIRIFKKKLRIYEIEVGAEKTFKTINDSILSIHNLYQEKKKPKIDLVQIVVDPEEYFEQLDIEWNYPSLLKIVSSSEIPFRLMSKTNQSAVKIQNAPGVMLECLEIIGEFSHAIELLGCTGSVLLQNIYISGFNQTGIFISKDIYDGVIKLIVHEVEMADATDQSRGMVINPRCYADFEASITKVKFIGPMESGIEINSPVRLCKIQECVFANMQYGISITSVLEPFDLLEIINNTFYRLEYGIVAERLDGLMVPTKQIHLFNNLFARLKKSEFTIIKEANPQVMASIFDSLYKFSEGNLTDGEPFFSRSSQRVLIFQNPRLDKYVVQFVTENSQDSNFLSINTNEKIRAHLLSFRGSRPFLGGVPPRGHQDRLYDLALEVGTKISGK